MGTPFSGRHLEFQAYRDFLAEVPQDMRHLPAYITEADPSVAWPERNTGWVRAAYDEIAAWNRSPGAQTIRCLALYRWDGSDRWRIRDKRGALNDFRLALGGDHRWRFPLAEMWRRKDAPYRWLRCPCMPYRAMAKTAVGPVEDPAIFAVELVDGRPVMADGASGERCEIGTGDDLRQGW